MSLPIGEADGNVVLTKAERDTHMHVIGSSGVGKSYFLEHMLRYDIKRGRGVCLIDPHGEMFDNIVTWLACSGYRSNEVHLIQPGRGENSVGFNPLASSGEPTRCVDDMVNAIKAVWGEKRADPTPRLEKCLRATLYALAVHNLSLLEHNIFTSTQFKEQRRQLVAKLPSKEARDEWSEFEAYSDKEFREYFESTRSRLVKFLMSPAIRPIIGQTANVLDFGQCMEKGHVVLVNLSQNNLLTKADAQLLGAMITAEMYSAAMQRDVGWAKSRPFYAVIDECAAYINEDIATSLDETRKFGLHYILSHQRLQQLRNVSDDCYDAVMSNAQTKVVFRVGDDDSAQTLCTQLFRSEFDIDRPKEILNKPIAVGQEIIELFSESETRSETHGTSEGQGFGQSATVGDTTSVGESIFDPIDGKILGTTRTVGSGNTQSSGSFSVSSTSATSSRSDGITQGSSQSLATIYEIMPTATYSLEEIAHLGTKAIRELPNRTAFLVRPQTKAMRISTLEVKGFQAIPGIIRSTKARIDKRSRFTKPQIEIASEIQDRQKSLFELDVIDVDEDYDGFD